jgi:hypothetical protein
LEKRVKLKNIVIKGSRIESHKEIVKNYLYKDKIYLEQLSEKDFKTAIKSLNVIQELSSVNTNSYRIKHLLKKLPSSIKCSKENKVRITFNPKTQLTKCTTLFEWKYWSLEELAWLSDINKPPVKANEKVNLGQILTARLVLAFRLKTQVNNINIDKEIAINLLTGIL